MRQPGPEHQICQEAGALSAMSKMIPLFYMGDICLFLRLESIKEIANSRSVRNHK